MTSTLNETHNPAARSWVRSANDATSDFPLQNLPYGRFRPSGSTTAWRCGVAIGDQVLDLAALATQTGWIRGADLNVALATQGVLTAGREDLRALMRLGPAAWHAVRLALFCALRDDAPAAVRATVQTALLPQAAAEFDTPVEIGEYTDFYTSLHHARNVGIAVGNPNMVTPNFHWMPIAYHGRASSLGVNQALHRPMGQVMLPGDAVPTFGPCQRLDYELEMAIYVGTDNARGQAVDMAAADAHIFGMGLLNDWSARDIQFWEMAPLGPFLGKNFATALSPWIVTMEALAPYRLPFARAAEFPAPLPYLDSPAVRAAGALDVELSVSLQTAGMRDAGQDAMQISQTNFRHQHWTIAQMLVHHTVGGCNLRAGDVLGTGTVSGPTAGEAGAMLELAMAGQRPITLANGEQRAFLEDGDAIVLHGVCQRPGAARIGFGECRGVVLPALTGPVM